MCIVSHIKTISSPFVLVTFNMYTCISVGKKLILQCLVFESYLRYLSLGEQYRFP